MRSLLYAAAFLPLQTLAWFGKASDIDEIVVVTTTRTITVCPITEAWTCGPDYPTAPWQDWTGTPTSTGSEVSPTSKGNGNGGHNHSGSPSSSSPTGHHSSGPHSSVQATWTSSSSPAGSPSSSGPYVGPSSSTSHGGPSSSGPYGSPSSSSPAGSPTSTSDYGTPTSSSSAPGDSSSSTDPPAGGSSTTSPSASSTSTDPPVDPPTSSSTTSGLPVDPATTSSSASSTSSDPPVDPPTTSSSATSTSSDPPVDPPTTSSSVTSTTSDLPVDPATTSSSASTTSSDPPVGPGTTSSTTSSAADPPAGTSTSTSSGSSTSSADPAGTSTSSSSSTSSDPPTSSTSSASTTSSSADPTSTTTSSSVDPVTTSSSTTITTTATLTSTTSRSATTTSSSTCAPSQTLSALPEQTSCPDNTADDRSQWCGKSVSDDTLVPYSSGQTKSFTLTITDADIDFDGTVRPAFAINGGTPGPAIEVNWGDEVVITVINLLTDNATTIHWHGIRQFGTNDQDGVPGVTECAIPPNGGQRTYTWIASTYGTGWYHSHTLSQYGGGIRGPIIIHGPATAEYDYDMGHVMIDEVFSQTIFQMAWNIARLRGPLPAAVNYMVNGQNKSPDGTAGKATEWTVEPGKKHLFRIINSSAQSSFIVHFDYHQMTVISSDYTPIVPYTTTSLYVNPGQRYNVIVEMDQTPGAYYMRAITQTGCGEQNVNTGLGIANPVFTYKGSCGTPTSETLSITPASDCRDEPLASLVPFVSKNGGSVDDFSDTAKLLPGGNGGSQVFDGYGSIIRWYFGGLLDLNGNSASVLGNQTVSVDFENPTLKTMAELPTLSFNSSKYSNAVVLDGPAGDWVYFVIQNNFQTSHPIHLHGHDFSVLGQGKGVFTADQVTSLNFANPCRRDTALLYGFAGPGGVAQSGWTVIGFQTDNPGAWIMHCHIIWHADGGMGLQYIEQPDAINANGYWTSSGFQDECNAYSSYQNGGGEGKLTYEAGIKRDLERHRYALKHKGKH
ncbi:uncharacterized protein PV07_05315 [Cladophialophora immunda]|uniref:laccase n=1 Tax=Cladophialophora immunda TaxID=569365 RepID=A0A0D2AW79_9EURO|nr:uncharacterized protein PV07_05315 [Cladophialophora immunda]KIW29502.1 hypothetical protein PV07_05315 [Cladophialophora immunda]OQV00667.1 hypothetical protein CLAIMM_06134 [Cladophialophora immunda]